MEGTRALPGRPDRGTHGLALVAAEVIENDDVGRLQRGDEDIFDVETEQLAVDRTIDDPWRVDPIVAQGSEEGHRLPMTIRRLGFEPSAPDAPSPQGRHIGLGPGLIDENKPPGIDLPLIGFPARPLAGDIRPVLLARQNAFF